MKLKCQNPKCGSENIRYVPHIYESGISHTQGRSVGFSSSGDLAVSGSVYTTVNQMAQKLAAPKPEPIVPKGCVIPAIVISLFLAWIAFGLIDGCSKSVYGADSSQRTVLDWFFGIAMFGTILVVGGLLFVFGESKEEARKIIEKNRQAQFDWEHSYICDVCGKVSVIRDS